MGNRVQHIATIDGSTYTYEIVSGAIPGYQIRVGDPVIMLTCQ